jgi:hypothetical protein
LIVAILSFTFLNALKLSFIVNDLKSKSEYALHLTPDGCDHLVRFQLGLTRPFVDFEHFPRAKTVEPAHAAS